MSIVVEYGNGELLGIKKKTDRLIPSPLKVCTDCMTIVSGELFLHDEESISKMAWYDNPDILNNIDGHIVIARAEEKKCYFASDRNNMDTFYYYHKDSSFILSDNFWDIVAIIQPRINDIDASFVRKSLIGCGTIDGTTIIKNINVLMPGENCVYDAGLNKLSIEKYCAFKYTGEISDERVAVERLDNILHSAISKIKSECGNVKYGIGISGGLDSRIISHYCKCHNMTNVGFNICVERPHRIFEAQSIKNAKRISMLYNIPFTPVDWKYETFQKKISMAISHEENFFGNSFKYEDENMPLFDVLLTGGSGMIVGSAFPANLDLCSKEQVVDEIMTLFGDYSSVTFANRAKRGLNYLFGGDFSLSRNMSSFFVDALCGRNWKQVTYTEIYSFVEEVFRRGGNAVDAFGDYFINVVGFKNRRGAFETLFSSKRSFSIYMPFCLEESLKWDFNLLRGRNVLKKLIHDKIPEVANVGTESFVSAPGHDYFFSKISTMLQFLVRGNGTAIDEHYLAQKIVVKDFLNTLNANPFSWFNVLFGLEKVIFTYDDIKNEPARIIARIWELKYLLDYLENKKYLNSSFWEQV